MFKQRKQFFLMLLLLGVSVQGAFASQTEVRASVAETQQQSKPCTGVVKDATGEAVIGASIVVKGTKTATVTNINGEFTLNNVNPGDVITISCLGYAQQEIT